jgi:hypothetical protein
MTQKKLAPEFIFKDVDPPNAPNKTKKLPVLPVSDFLGTP